MQEQQLLHVHSRDYLQHHRAPGNETPPPALTVRCHYMCDERKHANHRGEAMTLHDQPLPKRKKL